MISLADLASQLIAFHPGATWELVPFPAERKRIDIGDYYSDHTLAFKLLSWRPQVGLDTGLARTVSYYRKHLHSYL